jgi:hypothetical protein
MTRELVVLGPLPEVEFEHASRPRDQHRCVSSAGSSFDDLGQDPEGVHRKMSLARYAASTGWRVTSADGSNLSDEPVAVSLWMAAVDTE